MMMDIMFCPVCTGRVTVYKGKVLISRNSLLPNEVKIGCYIVCENCALVSEVDAQTGILIDLGRIQLSDILVPMDEPAVFVQVPSNPLLGRHDS